MGANAGREEKHRVRAGCVHMHARLGIVETSVFCLTAFTHSLLDFSPLAAGCGVDLRKVWRFCIDGGATSSCLPPMSWVMRRQSRVTGLTLRWQETLLRQANRVTGECRGGVSALNAAERVMGVGW